MLWKIFNSLSQVKHRVERIDLLQERERGDFEKFNGCNKESGMISQSFTFIFIHVD